MRRTLGVVSVSFSFLLSMSAFTQTFIENPARPDNPRAGRVVTLEEVMRIEDWGKDFYIKSVYGLAASRDGSVFVQDEQKQLLRFDPDGRFIGNLLKLGQGPGELTGLVSFLVAGSQVSLYGNPRKVVILDFEGHLVQEIPLYEVAGSLTDFIASTPEFLLFNRWKYTDPAKGDGWTSFSNEILQVSRRDGKAVVLADFPIPAYARAVAAGRRDFRMSGVLRTVSFDEATLGVSHSAEYMVKVFDLRNREVTTAFKRPYKRMKTLRGGGVRGMSNTFSDPPEFEYDISRIHSVDGRLWIQTSTADVEKGILFDVFDKTGRYVDCFFLRYKEGTIAPTAIFKRFVFSGGFVYFDDKTEDDLVVIRKCRMIGL